MHQVDSHEQASPNLLVNPVHWQPIQDTYPADQAPQNWDYVLLLQGPDRGQMLGEFFPCGDQLIDVRVITPTGALKATEIGLTQLAIVSIFNEEPINV